MIVKTRLNENGIQLYTRVDSLKEDVLSNMEFRKSERSTKRHFTDKQSPNNRKPTNGRIVQHNDGHGAVNHYPQHWLDCKKKLVENIYKV